MPKSDIQMILDKGLTTMMSFVGNVRAHLPQFLTCKLPNGTKEDMTMIEDEILGAINSRCDGVDQAQREAWNAEWLFVRLFPRPPLFPPGTPDARAVWGKFAARNWWPCRRMLRGRFSSHPSPSACRSLSICTVSHGYIFFRLKRILLRN